MCFVIGIVMEFIVAENCNIVDNNNDMVWVRMRVITKIRKKRQLYIALRQGSMHFDTVIHIKLLHRVAQNE